MQQNVVNDGNAGKGSAAVSVDAMQHFIGKHEPRVEHYTAPLIQVSVHHTGAEAIADRHDEHGSFIVSQALAADDGFRIGPKVAMAHHDQSRYAGRA